MTTYMSTLPDLGCSNPVHTPLGGGVLERRLVPFFFTYVIRTKTTGGGDGVESSLVLKTAHVCGLPMKFRPREPVMISGPTAGIARGRKAAEFMQPVTSVNTQRRAREAEIPPSCGPSPGHKPNYERRAQRFTMPNADPVEGIDS
jgi:hypothetical protein